MAGLTPAHLLVILIVAPIAIVPGKLPEVGAAMVIQEAATDVATPIGAQAVAMQPEAVQRPTQPVAAQGRCDTAQGRTAAPGFAGLTIACGPR